MPSKCITIKMPCELTDIHQEDFCLHEQLAKSIKNVLTWNIMKTFVTSVSFGWQQPKHHRSLYIFPQKSIKGEWCKMQLSSRQWCSRTEKPLVTTEEQAEGKTEPKTQSTMTLVSRQLLHWNRTPTEALVQSTGFICDFNCYCVFIIIFCFSWTRQFVFYAVNVNFYCLSLMVQCSACFNLLYLLCYMEQ